MQKGVLSMIFAVSCSFIDAYLRYSYIDLFENEFQKFNKLNEICFTQLIKGYVGIEWEEKV